MLAQPFGDFLLRQPRGLARTPEALTKELVARGVDGLEHIGGVPCEATQPANADFGLCKK